jgi:hypothetical protein
MTANDGGGIVDERGHGERHRKEKLEPTGRSVGRVSFEIVGDGGASSAGP